MLDPPSHTASDVLAPVAEDQDPMGLVRSILADVARGTESLVQGRKLARGPGALHRLPAEEDQLAAQQSHDQDHLLGLIHQMTDEVHKRDEALADAQAAIAQLDEAIQELDGEEAKHELEKARNIQEQQQRAMAQEREDLLERIAQTANVLRAPGDPALSVHAQPVWHPIAPTTITPPVPIAPLPPIEVGGANGFSGGHPGPLGRTGGTGAEGGSHVY